MQEQLQSAKQQLTKKDSTTELVTPANENEKSFLIDSFLSAAPDNGRPEKVLWFMRALLLKYAIYVAYLGIKVSKSQGSEADKDKE